MADEKYTFINYLSDDENKKDYEDAIILYEEETKNNLSEDEEVPFFIKDLLNKKKETLSELLIFHLTGKIQNRDSPSGKILANTENKKSKELSEKIFTFYLDYTIVKMAKDEIKQEKNLFEKAGNFRITLKNILDNPSSIKAFEKLEKHKNPLRGQLSMLTDEDNIENFYRNYLFLCATPDFLETLKTHFPDFIKNLKPLKTTTKSINTHILNSVTENFITEINNDGHLDIRTKIWDEITKSHKGNNYKYTKKYKEKTGKLAALPQKTETEIERQSAANQKQPAPSPTTAITTTMTTTTVTTATTQINITEEIKIEIESIEFAKIETYPSNEISTDCSATPPFIGNNPNIMLHHPLSPERIKNMLGNYLKSDKFKSLENKKLLGLLKTDLDSIINIALSNPFDAKGLNFLKNLQKYITNGWNTNLFFYLVPTSAITHLYGLLDKIGQEEKTKPIVKAIKENIENIRESYRKQMDEPLKSCGKDIMNKAIIMLHKILSAMAKESLSLSNDHANNNDTPPSPSASPKT